MSNVGSFHANQGLNVYHVCLDPITTTNATPVKIASIPIPQNKTFDITVYSLAVKSDGLTRNSGPTRGVFYRTTGNISQEGTLRKDLLGILSTAQVTFTPNNTTFEVEMYANGLTATTINWSFDLDVIFNT